MAISIPTTKTKVVLTIDSRGEKKKKKTRNLSPISWDLEGRNSPSAQSDWEFDEKMMRCDVRIRVRNAVSTLDGCNITISTYFGRQLKQIIFFGHEIHVITNDPIFSICLF